MPANLPWQAASSGVLLRVSLTQLARHALLCRSTRIDSQVVIGTHGTLKNWVSKRALSPDHMRILVLDEADDMLKVCSVSACRLKLYEKQQ